MRISLCVTDALRERFAAEETAVWHIIRDLAPGSLAKVSSIGHIPIKRTRLICKNLANEGWISLVKEPGRVTPLATIPRSIQKLMLDTLEKEYNAAPLKAEFLMKSFLDLVIRSQNYTDNARLEFLRNVTGEMMEIDRYYHDEKVGFECNGRQHLGTTQKFPDEKAAAEQISRDGRKVWLCEKQDVILVTIFPSHLHPRLMSKLIPPGLERNTVDEIGPYYRGLERLCEAYIQKATRVDVKAIMAEQS